MIKGNYFSNIALLIINTVNLVNRDIARILVNYSVRDGPFNFQGGGRLWFFSKKNILIPTNVAEKNILILVEGKNKYDSEFLSYNLMLNSG